MNYLIEKNTIKIMLPAKNHGKFRYKNRIGLNEFDKLMQQWLNPMMKEYI